MPTSPNFSVNMTFSGETEEGNHGNSYFILQQPFYDFKEGIFHVPV